MPQYSYQCECGVRFESHASIADREKPKTCPDCGKSAPRWVPDDIHGTFDLPVSGPIPQNTGVASIDIDHDRAIGMSAKQGWEVQKKRYQEKVEIMQSAGVAGSDLSRNPDGSYRVLSPEEKGVFERGHSINQTAMEKRKTLKDQI